MDFKLTDNLDIYVEGGEVQQQVDNETTMLQAFFSDGRVNEQRGYWLDVPLSEMWQFDQKRLNTDTVNDLNETAKEVAKKLVSLGVYDRIETNAFIQDNVLTLNIKAYDKKNLVFDRKFAV